MGSSGSAHKDQKLEEHLTAISRVQHTRLATQPGRAQMPHMYPFSMKDCAQDITEATVLPEFSQVSRQSCGILAESVLSQPRLYLAGMLPAPHC